MKTLIASLLALSLSAPAAAQSPPVTACPPTSVLAQTPTAKGIGVITLNKVCPLEWNTIYAAASANAPAIMNMNGPQALAWVLGIALPAPPVTQPTPKDTVVAPPPPIATPPAPPAPTPPPAVSSWTKLGAAGQLYSFTGLHAARWTLGDSAKALYTTVYGVLECGLSGFNNKAPSGGSGLGTCELGPTLYDTLSVPQVMGPITAAAIVTPKGSPGIGVERVRASGGAGIRTDGTGSFRTTCELSKFIFDDPIVFPGVTGVSHLHMLFGNTAVTGLTNSLTLASSGNSTCIGGIDNRTAYWTPAMIDASGNAVMPDRSAFYYKSGQYLAPSTIQTLPVGLKMIAGDKSATGPQYGSDLSDPTHPKPGPMQVVTWTCLNGKASSPNAATIPACAAGDEVRLTVIFPQCWDGKNLDSPDHKSHVAYPIYAKRQCPSTHPVPIPEITEHFDFPVTPGANPSTWHLSSDTDLTKPGGLSAHADWMNGWDPATMLLIVQNCLQKALDCEIGGLGGRILY